MKIRRKLFSKMEDQDYIEGHENRKKSVKHAKGVGTAAGSVIGAGIGHSIGKGFGKKGAIAGTAIGAVSGGTLGRLTGKAIKKSTEDDANKKIARYKNASEHDKKYIREKEEKEKDREINAFKAKEVMETIQHLGENWDTFSTEEKQRVCKDIIDKIVLTPNGPNSMRMQIVLQQQALIDMVK